MSSIRDVQDRSESVDDEAAEDARLVGQALAGDADAFGVLARRYQRRVFAVAYRLLNNQHDALDVAQDALLRAYRSLDQLTDPLRFGPWLMRIVANLSFNYRRSRKASAAVGLGGMPAALSGHARANALRPGERHGRSKAAMPPGSPDDDIRERELRAAVGAAMEELPEKQRLALVLCSIAGVPQQEVAQMLSCSVELVKWNVFQARKTLKQRLEQYLTAD